MKGSLSLSLPLPIEVLCPQTMHLAWLRSPSGAPLEDGNWIAKREEYVAPGEEGVCGLARGNPASGSKGGLGSDPSSYPQWISEPCI